MKRVAVVLAALALSSCSIFSNTVPKSNVKIFRSDVDASGKLIPSSGVDIPNQWAEENIVFELEEVYQDNPEGREVLSTRIVRIIRITDPALAAEVAKFRASRGAEVSETITENAATVGMSAITGQVVPIIGGVARGIRETEYR